LASTTASRIIGLVKTKYIAYPLPFLVISSYAKQNFVDSTLTDLTSILRFVEDNWNLGRLGDQSFDVMAGSILNIFDFSGQRIGPPLFLDPTTGLVTDISGEVASSLGEASRGEPAKGRE